MGVGKTFSSVSSISLAFPAKWKQNARLWTQMSICFPSKSGTARPTTIRSSTTNQSIILAKSRIKRQRNSFLNILELWNIINSPSTNHTFFFQIGTEHYSPPVVTLIFINVTYIWIYFDNQFRRERILRRMAISYRKVLFFLCGSRLCLPHPVPKLD